MIPEVGRRRLIIIAAILAVFFAVEFAMNGFESPPRQQAPTQAQPR
ncbi:MAG: hypothetical protein JSS04_05780 [Proteobacteria bacterium]|nr:hypothetical protein [Pseudomonadota bacterium]